jgi:hypothetical protein
MPAAIVAIVAAGAGAAAAVSIGGVLGAMAGAAIAMGISYGGYTLGIGVVSPVSQANARGIMINYSATDAPIVVRYGTRRAGGPLIYLGSAGRIVDPSSWINAPAWNDYLWIVMILGEGECDTESLTDDDIWFDGTSLSDHIADYRAHVVWGAMSGSDDQEAAPELVAGILDWGADCRLRGVAYAWFRIQFSQAYFGGGMPQITVYCGKKLYDPRTATTAWSNNAALCVRDYLLNPIYGWGAHKGITVEDIDEASFIAGANYCDQLITVDGVEMQRYRCNGVLDPSQDPDDNMQSLLSSLRGQIVESGGKYKLFVDAPRAPADFEFTKDNIIGDWIIQMGSRATRLNRVKAKYYRWDADWQPDYAIADSPSYRTVDGELFLEQEINLPFTSDSHRAGMLAAQHLAGSRRDLLVQFNAPIEGARCEVGDVVPITHDRPGWSEKLLDIKKIDLLPDGTCRIVARDYDPSAYDYDNVIAADDPPDTELLDPLTVQPPGSLALEEELYSTRNGAGVKAKATITWSESPDAWVTQYQVEMKRSSWSEFKLTGVTPGTTLEVLDIEPGVYWVRARSMSSLGVMSAYSSLLLADVSGLLALPASVTGLTVTAISGVAMLSWDHNPDLDVRIGGRIRFRHYQGATPAWNKGGDLGGGAVPGGATTATLPLMQGYYMAKAVDSSGQESTTEAIVYNSAPSPFVVTENAASPIQEDDTFTGTKTDCEVISSALRLTVVAGEVTAAGTYMFANSLDLGAVEIVQLRPEIDASVANVQDLFDSRTTLMDDWPSWDGSAEARADVAVYVRHKDTAGGAWSDWERLSGVGDFSGRYFEFKAGLTSSDVAHNIVISQLRVRVWNY